MLPQLVARRAAEHPERIFLEHVDGTTTDYGTLHARAMTWAAAYRRAGVKAGDRVVTMMGARFEFYYSWLGLSWLRGIDTPVNTDYVGEMLAHVLSNSGAAVVVLEARFLDRFVALAPGLATLPRLVVLDSGSEALDVGPFTAVAIEQFLAGEAACPDELSGPQLWDAATVVYTSGTTGPSKGVIQPWNQLYHLAIEAFPAGTLGPDDSFYLPVVTYHMGAKAMPYLMALVDGVVVIRDRFSASEFLNDIDRHGCTVTVMVAFIAQLMAAAVSTSDDSRTSLRYALMAPIIPDVEAFSKRFGVKVCTAYGMTELAPVIGSNGWDVDNTNFASCGRLRPGYEARIVDQHDVEVPDGTVGELIVRSRDPWALNQGYLGAPEATVRAWRNGWFHTGDGFRRDVDGNYYFLDRLKDAIRRRGENISSFEVESIVMSHPEVVHAAAVAVPSEYSEDEVKIVVVRGADSQLTPPQLIDYLVPIMPRFMVPRYVEFVAALPTTPTDRIRKAVLRAAGVTATTWDREAGGQ